MTFQWHSGGAISKGITIAKDFLVKIENRFAKSDKVETSMLFQCLISMKYKGKKIVENIRSTLWKYFI